jgi:hypothetical protein
MLSTISTQLHTKAWWPLAPRGCRGTNRGGSARLNIPTTPPPHLGHKQRHVDAAKVARHVAVYAPALRPQLDRPQRQAERGNVWHRFQDRVRHPAAVERTHLSTYARCDMRPKALMHPPAATTSKCHLQSHARHANRLRRQEELCALQSCAVHPAIHMGNSKHTPSAHHSPAGLSWG